jgi:hypothetical protein
MGAFPPTGTSPGTAPCVHARSRLTDSGARAIVDVDVVLADGIENVKPRMLAELVGSYLEELPFDQARALLALDAATLAAALDDARRS